MFATSTKPTSARSAHRAAMVVPDSLKWLASHIHDAFAVPFERQTPRRYLMLQNIANTHPACMYRPDGTLLQAFNEPGPASPHGLIASQSKATRWLAATRGKIPMLTDAGARDYSRYLIGAGWLEAADLDHALAVSSLTDYDHILRRAADENRVIVPYNPTPDFIELCERYGLATYTPAAPSVSRLANKHHFRQLIRSTHPQFSAYDHEWFAAGTTPSARRLEQLMSYYGDDPSPAGDVLFVQKEVGAGGAGNFRITRHPDGSFSINGQPNRLPNLRALQTFIAGLNANGEVAPFLRLEVSPSFGLVIGRDGASCVGPFHQILDDNHENIGFKLNHGGSLGGFSPAVAEFLRANLRELLQLCLAIGQRQQRAGYLGYSSIDLLIYRDADGRLQLGLSEENQRYTSTCMLQMLIHGRPDLHRRFLEGRLSLMQHDAMALSPRVLAATHGRATRLASLLQAAGVPLLGSTTTEGIVIMAQPNTSGHGFVASLGVVAGHDDYRDALFAQAVAALA